MKATLVVGLCAAGLAVVGGMLGQRWLIAPGVVGLLLVVLVLPWLRPADAAPRNPDRTG